MGAAQGGGDGGFNPVRFLRCGVLPDFVGGEPGGAVVGIENRYGFGGLDGVGAVGDGAAEAEVGGSGDTLASGVVGEEGGDAVGVGGGGELAEGVVEEVGGVDEGG